MQLQAFVGYRDHSLPHHRFEVKDFLLKEDSVDMHSFVCAIRAISNSDTAEDVAGGLEVFTACVSVEGLPRVQQLLAVYSTCTSSVCYQTCRRPVGDADAALLSKQHCSAYAEHLRCAKQAGHLLARKLLRAGTVCEVQRRQVAELAHRCWCRK